MYGYEDWKKYPGEFLKGGGVNGKVMYATANGALYMRAEPDTESEVLVAIPTGDAVTVISIYGE